MALERFDESPWANAGERSSGWERGHVPAFGRELRDGETSLRPQRVRATSRRWSWSPDDVGSDDDESMRPCDGPPHHNPRCCLAPKPSKAMRWWAWFTHSLPRRVRD